VRKSITRISLSKETDEKQKYCAKRQFKLSQMFEREGFCRHEEYCSYYNQRKYQNHSLRDSKPTVIK
jgi:hypothetical protein